MCVQPSFLTALISLASLLVVIVVAGQRENTRTVAVVASNAGLSSSLSPTDRGPGSFTLSVLSALRLVTVRHPTGKSSTAFGISYSNLIKINTGPFIQEFSKHFKVMFLNAQSVRNKARDICDYIMQANVDLVFLCET